MSRKVKVGTVLANALVSEKDKANHTPLKCGRM